MHGGRLPMPRQLAWRKASNSASSTDLPAVPDFPPVAPVPDNGGWDNGGWDVLAPPGLVH